MKVKPRDTHRRAVAKRITAPETKLDQATGKKIAMLGYIDSGAYQQHVPATKDLFLYAAGTSREGEVPDGLDRLLHHEYVVHLSKGGKAVGLDVIPSRMYRSGAVPVSQEGINTLVVRYDLDGAVARVVQRPFNLPFNTMAAVIQEIDKLIRDGLPIKATDKLGNLGRVVSTTDNTVEVRMNASPRRVQGAVDPEDGADDIEEDVT